VFADAGIAGSESRDFTTRRARGGLGGGVRLLVPGSEMVRLDLGWCPSPWPWARAGATSNRL